MVWSLGVSTGAQISDRTAFVLSGDSSDASVANTDNSWEVEEDKGVQTLPTPPEIQRYYYRSGAGGAHRWRTIRLVLERRSFFARQMGEGCFRLEMPSSEDQYCRTTTGN